MRVVNKLTKPGGIRRVDLMTDTVHIQTSDGQDRVYRLTSCYTGENGQETVLDRIAELPLDKEQGK